MNYRHLFLMCGLTLCLAVVAQPKTIVPHQIEPPLRIPLFLSGNFGELRGNHFHSGIDLKTQGAVGKPVYSIDKGYVSRVSVSPYGYGNALYITHPSTGLTSVCGHLNGFAPKIDSIVKARQYEQESFAVDLSFSPGEIPVVKGERVAVSGNTGSSGGPHVHFELRRIDTQAPIDPLPYFQHRIKDTRKPDIRGIALYAVPGKGVASKTGYIPLASLKNGKKTVQEELSSWGEIYLGVKAYDCMDSAANIYGVHSIQLQVDSQLVFSSVLAEIPFDKSRYLNSFIDYNDWAAHRSFVMRSYVEPGNSLNVYGSVKNRGIVTIDEERDYKCTYVLRDVYGNRAELKFTIHGRRREIPQEPVPDNAALMAYDQENVIDQDGVMLDIPAGALYDNLWFRYDCRKDSTYYSDVFQLHDDKTPMHQAAKLRIRIENDVLADKSKYCLANVSGGHSAATYRDGFLETDIRSFGTYAVSCDTVPPVITPLTPEKWGTSGVIRFRISDNRTGIGSYRGELDGRFVLFEMDGKSATIRYAFDRSRIKRGQKHNLVLRVVDNCGNERLYERSVTW